MASDARSEGRCRVSVDEAVDLAARCGIAPVARGLYIAYGALKRRLKSNGRSRSGASRRRFVEVRSLDPILEGGRIVVEFADAGGARVTCRLPADAGIDLAALAGAFWNRTR